MKILYFWKSLLWLLVICYLSLMPGDGLPRVPLFNIPHFDKIVHFGFYFILTILLIKPFKKTINKYSYITALLISATLSGAIELLQKTVTTTRHGDIYDFIANLLGISFALITYRIIISGSKLEKLV